MPEAKIAITNTIRELRRERRALTQQELADICGVTRQTIVAIEGGKYAPSLELAFRIAIAFELPLEAVFRASIARPVSSSTSGKARRRP